MTDETNITVGELARSVSSVLIRLEGLARRLEDGQFVRTEMHNLYKENVNLALMQAQEKIRTLGEDKVDKAEYQALQKRVVEIEDSKKWLERLVLGFIILTILGVILAASGGVSVK